MYTINAVLIIRFNRRFKSMWSILDTILGYPRTAHILGTTYTHTYLHVQTDLYWSMYIFKWMEFLTVVAFVATLDYKKEFEEIIQFIIILIVQTVTCKDILSRLMIF